MNRELDWARRETHLFREEVRWADGGLPFVESGPKPESYTLIAADRRGIPLAAGRRLPVERRARIIDVTGCHTERRLDDVTVLLAAPGVWLLSDPATTGISAGATPSCAGDGLLPQLPVPFWKAGAIGATARRFLTIPRNACRGLPRIGV